MRRTVFVVVGTPLLAAALLFGACGDDDKSSPTTTKGGGALDIVTFDVPAAATCDTAEGTVEVSWTTTGADEVRLFVDNEQQASGPDPEGSDTLTVPCDGDEHAIGIQALSESGEKVSDAKDVSTTEQSATTTTAAGRAQITEFTVGAVTCSGATGTAAMTWATSDAESVSFLVDGQDPGAQAGFEPSGSGNSPPVPCNGQEHEITLVAVDADGATTESSVTITTPNA